MVSDARSNTKTYWDTHVRNSQLTKDDDYTQAGFAILYEEVNYPLVKEFRGVPSVDLLLLVGIPVSTPFYGHDVKAYGYRERVPTMICCIDKTGITGTKLLWKTVAELRYVTENYPEGSLRSLEVMEPTTRNLGGVILHQQRVILDYRRGLS